MKQVVSALAAAFIATIGASSGAHAALIDFSVAVLDGSGLGYSGPDLNASTAFNLDGATLAVSSVAAGDDSGLTPFEFPPLPTINMFVSVTPSNIIYGSGTGSVALPGTGIVKAWTGIVGGVDDSFTETLTEVDSINRGTKDAVTITLSGTVSDSLGNFVDTPVHMILQANQVAGHGGSIIAGFTNTTTTVPEPSTWVMLALGFAGLGYAAVRRGAKDRSALAI
jgi:hypothetical protein